MSWVNSTCIIKTYMQNNWIFNSLNGTELLERD